MKDFAVLVYIEKKREKCKYKDILYNIMKYREKNLEKKKNFELNFYKHSLVEM